MIDPVPSESAGNYDPEAPRPVSFLRRPSNDQVTPRRVGGGWTGCTVALHCFDWPLPGEHITGAFKDSPVVPCTSSDDHVLHPRPARGNQPPTCSGC
jgi:hypothetical protein